MPIMERWKEDFDNGRRSFIISLNNLFTTTYKICEVKLHESFRIILLLELKQYIYFYFEPKQLPTVVRC